MPAPHGVSRVGVVGAGQMGLGIAYVCATHARVAVSVCDASTTQLAKGVSFFDKLLAKDTAKGRMTSDEAEAARARLSTLPGIPEFQSAKPQMVIEAATESLPIKEKIFAALAESLPLQTILATNTSSISVTKIAAAAVAPAQPAQATGDLPKGPERVVGLHFFNPVPVMKLVELIPALQTSDTVLARAKAFAEACGKTVTVSQDVPGFVSNRLLMPFINEAVITLESGVSSKEDIDTCLKLGMAHPMGPLQLADFIGLDTCLYIMQTLYAETADSKYRPSVLLGRMVNAGWLGKKSGKGFYDY